MRDRPFITRSVTVGILLPALTLVACAPRGDFGREAPPTPVLRAYDAAEREVDRLLERDRIPDLPLTAAEDRLRGGVADIAALHRRAVRDDPGSGDGFSLIEALAVDIEVERERFRFFFEAATKAAEIDDAREQRLKGVDAFEARRQYRLVRERRKANGEAIRTGLRLMRELLSDERARMQRLSLHYPDVPLEKAAAAYDAAIDEVVAFHAQVDAGEHERLAGSNSAGYKR